MIKVSVMYPNGPDAKFDMEYYVGTHIALIAESVGDALKGASVDQGIAGGVPGEAPAYVAMGHVLFESLEAFQTSFGPHADKIMGDIPNFTNITPIMQISDVKL